MQYFSSPSLILLLTPTGLLLVHVDHAAVSGVSLITVQHLASEKLLLTHHIACCLLTA